MRLLKTILCYLYLLLALSGWLVAGVQASFAPSPLVLNHCNAQIQEPSGSTRYQRDAFGRVVAKYQTTLVPMPAKTTTKAKHWV